MRRAFLLPFLALLFTAGCRPGEERVSWPAREKTYRTVASLSPSTTELVGSLAYGLQLVGRTASCDFPAAVSAAPVVAQVKPDYEKLKAANPSLVIYDKGLYSDSDIAQIKALGIDTFEFKGNTIADFTKEVMAFGSLIGAEMEASTYIDKIDAEKREPISPEARVAIIMPGKSGEHLIAGVNSFHADVVKNAGGVPVGPDSDKYVSISAEALIKLNPDMIITAGKPDALMADPRLKSLSAIAKVKVRGINSEYMTRRGYRVEKELNLMNRAIMDMAGNN